MIRLVLLCSLFFSVTASSQFLKVSSNGRFLVKDTGQPFFWLGDTGWELFHRLDRSEAEYYLRNRSGKGFTVIQAVLLSEINGLTVPNREGHLPLIDLDPERPDEEYFKMVDFVINKAAELGLYMALLPTWGAYVEDRPHPLFDNNKIFDPQKARAYGEFLGARYKDKWNIVWVLGGDRPADEQMDTWDALAEGLRKGDQGKHLITYHPRGQQSSSFWLHEKDWLDFNMIQTGHLRFSDNVYDWVENDYRLDPVKPVIDGEPAYEDIPEWFNPANPRWNDYEIRKLAYWSVFAGAFGHTYGNNNIWQMYRPEYEPVIWARIPWNEALEQPGAAQLKHLRFLMESRPFLERIPDQDILEAENHSFATDYIRVTRDGTKGHKDATYIMAYLPVYRSFSINTSVIDSDRLKIWWFSPATGDVFPVGVIENTGNFSHSNWSQVIRETQLGPDWVVVIEDAGKNYPPPGRFNTYLNK